MSPKKNKVSEVGVSKRNRGFRVTLGVNDLLSRFPKIAADAYDWDPSNVAYASDQMKQWKCEAHPEPYSSTIVSRTRVGTGCRYCSGRQTLVGFNDLATVSPDIAAEAYGWDPQTLTVASGKRKEWRCRMWHNYFMTVNKRRQGRNCPYCSNQKVLIGYNDLATTHPEIASEAYRWDPKTVSYGTRKKKEWLCPLPNHNTYTMPVNKRTTRGSGCQICAGQKILIGFNDLKFLYPWIATQAYDWDPETVTQGSGLKRKWICSLGHIWTARVAARTRGSGCAKCSKRGFNPDREGYLYFIFHPVRQMLQIGITNAPKDRLRTHKNFGWEVLEITESMEGKATRQMETQILRMLKKRGLRLTPENIAGRFDGYTESWIKDLLPVASIQELLNLVEDKEELIKIKEEKAKKKFKASK